MNKAKLKAAEEKFIMRYPGGFTHPQMLELAKKHKVEKMKQLAQDRFAIEKFGSSSGIIDSMGKVVSQSSLFKIFVFSMNY
ncbi:hypothetical protein HA075_19850 [bacterium BFN5]|nr:hypothetical protein HA075_19850 [bacterium BFN5]